MPDELSYVLITPHSIHKSRTGGIISRLLSRSGLELVAGKLFAPSKELVEAYAAGIVTEEDDRHRRTQQLLRDYVVRQFSPDADGRPRRVLMLVLRGADAVQRTLDVAGHMAHGTTRGETIRDTYGDYLVDGERVTYFEPAVVVAPTPETATRDLALWANHSKPGLLRDVPVFPIGAEVQETLVLLKPDNFRFPNARPGGAIDLFSRTGLFIVGFKVHHMSVAEAMEFYGPVLPTLREAFKEPTGKIARQAVERELGINFDESVEEPLGELLGPDAGEDRWETLVEFMTGQRPSEVPESGRTKPGTEKCVALIYRGPDAVRKIREVLGPTDPSKAPTGTIRREFGASLMVNAAHASDSPENAAREMKIIRADENNLKALVESNRNAA